MSVFFEPRFLRNLPKLNKISLDNKNVEDFHDLSSLEADKLDMNTNKIERLDKPGLLPMGVKQLILYSNLISFIDEGYFLNLTQLEEIDLKNNKLKSLETVWFNSDNLILIDLSHNSLFKLKSIEFRNTNPLNNLSLFLNNNEFDSVPLLNGSINSMGSFNFGYQNSGDLLDLSFNFSEQSLVIDRFDLSGNRFKSNENEMFCSIDSNIGIRNMVLANNNFTNKIVCAILAQINYKESFEILMQIFPQNDLNCSLVSKKQWMLLKKNNVRINCELNDTQDAELNCEHDLYSCDNFYNKISDKPGTSISNNGISKKQLNFYLYSFLCLCFLFLCLFIKLYSTK